MATDWGGTGDPVPPLLFSTVQKGQMVKSNKILGREPAVFFLGLVAPVLLAVIKFLPFTPEVSGALNAVVLAAAGAAVAVMVATDKVLPALLGLAGAVFALYQAFGTAVPENTQTGILELIAVAAALFTRQNVEAPVMASGGTLGEMLAEAYRNGYMANQDDAVPAHPEPGEDMTQIMDAVREDAPPIPSGEHADGPDFRGRLS